MKHVISLGVIFISVLQLSRCSATAIHPKVCNNCDCQSDEKSLQLKVSDGKIFVCSGGRWKPLLYEEYGVKSHPGFSCKDIKGYNGKESANGIHWIKLKDKTGAFPVYCDMANGGWTMVFKAVGGAHGDVYEAYTSGYTFSENVLAALDVTALHNDHYKNRIVLNWKHFNPSEVRVVLYKCGELKKELKFNAKDSDAVNWFSSSKLLPTDSWSDLKTQPNNFFSIKGSETRRFFINRNYGGCPKDAGWMVVSNLNHCHWEKRGKENVILYSKGGGYTTWRNKNQVEEADVLVVYVR